MTKVFNIQNTLAATSVGCLIRCPITGQGHLRASFCVCNEQTLAHFIVQSYRTAHRYTPPGHIMLTTSSLSLFKPNIMMGKELPLL